MATMTKTRKAVKTGGAKPAALVSLALAIDHTVYNVEPIPAGEFGTKAFRLTKHAAKDDCYDVIRTNEGLVECSCPSYEVTYRGTCGCCKHGQALVKMGLLDAPVYQPQRQLEPIGDKVIAHVADEFDAPTADEPANVQAETVNALVDSLVPIGTTPAAEPDPLAEWERPVRKTAEKAASKPAVPLRPLPLTPGTLYSLDELVSGQAALFRGTGGAAYQLIADELDALAARIRGVQARTPDEYLGRIAEMERSRDEQIRAEGFDRGYQQARDEAA